MEPQMLIDPTSAGVPAPLWFVQFFKCLGFSLHMVPMNLWYAGMLVALWLHLRGNEHARHFAARLLQQMPVIIALGVNFGVVPLLFVQLAYYKAFYPATILMAWFWLGIIGLLIPAYYGVYAYAWAIRNGTNGMAGWRITAGWMAAAFFIVIGFLFANGLSLMDHVERWPALWEGHSTAGAALGTALNVGDPTLWPRWLLMFGLALTTTAVWLLVDVFWLTGKTDEAYQLWAIGFVRKLYTVGLLWAAVAGAWYVLGTWSEDLLEHMLLGPLVYLTLATAMSPGLPWALIMSTGLCPTNKAAENASGAEAPNSVDRNAKSPPSLNGSRCRSALVAVIALCQFGVLGLNAISRQVVQNFNLKPYLDVMALPEDVQWSPLAMFLIVFVLGLAVVGWMLLQVQKSKA